MNTLTVTVDNHETNIVKEFETDGCIVLYLDGGRIHGVIDIDMKAIAPFLMKMALDKMTKDVR